MPNENTCDKNLEAECMSLREVCRELKYRIQMLEDEKNKISILYEKLLKEKSDQDLKMGYLEGQVEAYKFIWSQKR